MMPIRVPDMMLKDTALLGIARSSVEVAKLNAQISSGKRLQSPADDPIAYARAKDLNTVLTATDQYSANIDRANGSLSVAESSLASMEDVLARAKEIALDQANPTYDASQRAVMAQGVQQLIDEMVGLGNTQVDGRYVFAGNKTDASPYDAAGTYSGDSGVRNVEVGNGVQVAENVTGDQFLGGAGGGVDVFAVLTQLRDALQANDVAGISATIDPLDTAGQQVTQARMTVGFRMDKLQTQSGILSEVKFQTQQMLSSAQDVDMTQAISDLVLRQNTLDVARATLAKILGGGSIMQYLP
jgi:flagellar hook-associated protein 3 FlgL